jgi:PAS domain-containing protein
VRNDLEQVKKLFAPEVKVFASLAPSFAAEFYGCKPQQIIRSLKRLGFYGVSETALGADFVSADLASSLKAAGEKDGQKLFLSSACPAVVLYIQRYAPAFVPCLNDRASPLLAHAGLLRAVYGKTITVVFIGPCIAKKREADQLKEIDAAITFNELKLWFQEAGITPEAIPEDECGEEAFVPCRAAQGGSIFPVDGGMLIALKKQKDFSQTPNMVISGIDAVAETLNRETFLTDQLESPLFLELLACQGGCVNGPGTAKDASAILRRARLLSYAESANDRLDDETLSTDISLTGTLAAAVIPSKAYSNLEIRHALGQIGKYQQRDELNCSRCGYESCRDFARALLENRAEKAMCAGYLRNLAQGKANALIKTSPNGIVIVDKHYKIVECNKNFARLMGSETEELFEIAPDLQGLDLSKLDNFSVYFEEAFSADPSDSSFDYDIREGEKILHLNVHIIEKGEIAAGVLSDITIPQIRRDKTVARAKQIIEKNVKTVQKIAFLLGENAAETEGILYSIIESHTGEKSK